ncbi:acyl-CoA thioester hydrolase YciA [Neisseria sp. WLZKY-1]|uniref:acyl-CoA thioester hydrolase YciA n=1 Tax=Neisseria sp. WLZKY-1 TaxID=3390377 RepID=UPI00397B8860
MNKQDAPTRTEPQGSLLLRTMTRPADTNPNGDIFGGWLMSQMDIAGGILACETARGRIVTVAADKIVFHRPVAVGDIVGCYGTLVKTGNTSMQIHIEVWVHSASFADFDEQRLVTEALFTYVAIDENGRPRPVGQSA